MMMASSKEEEEKRKVQQSEAKDFQFSSKSTKCPRCSVIISNDMLFCPHCGSALLQSLGRVVNNLTTANYDPLNPDHKPWREKPLIPTRKYQSFLPPGGKASLSPWYPAMKHGQRPKKVKSKPLPNQTSKAEEKSSTKLETNDSTKSDKIPEGVENKDVISSPTESVVDNHRNTPASVHITILKERISPLAAYEIAFDCSAASEEFHIVSIALVDHEVTDSLHRVYWLKVSLSEEGHEADESHFKLLAYLSNAEGKLMLGKELFDQWVNLSSVSPFSSIIHIKSFKN